MIMSAVYIIECAICRIIFYFHSKLMSNVWNSRRSVNERLWQIIRNSLPMKNQNISLHMYTIRLLLINIIKLN
jgi:hypothetical protein